MKRGQKYYNEKLKIDKTQTIFAFIII